MRCAAGVPAAVRPGKNQGFAITEEAPVPTSIDREGLRRLLDEGAVLVEVLEESQYRAAHLPGAVHVPAWELTEERAQQLPTDRPLVVYCFDTQ